MNFNRYIAIAASAAALITTVGMAAPASAATVGSTCPFSQSGSNETVSYYVQPTRQMDMTSFYSWLMSQGNTIGVAKAPVGKRHVAKKPATKAPATQAPATKAPATQAPAQKAPATQAPAAPAQPSTSAGMTAEEQQMLTLINGARAQAGLAPLKADAKLTQLARMKSQDMINRNYFDHNSPTYGSPFQMMQNAGVTYQTAGENIAGNPSVEGAFQAWMNSPGHRENILNGQYNTTGIGIVHGGEYGIMFTQEFVGR